MTDRRRRLRQRILSALALATVSAAAVWYSETTFGLLVLVVAFGVLFEHETVAGAPSIQASVVIVGILVLCATQLIGGDPEGDGFAIVAALAAASLYATLDALFRRKHPGWSLFAAIYVIGPAIAMVTLRGHGPEPVFWLFAVVWMTDVGAWMAGSTLRGPKLWPRVSPNKHWSGALGGLLAGTLAGLAVHALADWPVATRTAVLAGIAVSVAAQAGDLLESAWKRHFKVKDSGAIIPGHGGVMDRVDGLIVAAVVLTLGFELMGASR